MKPSERRALEEEKRRQKEAADREKLLEAKAKRQMVNDSRQAPINDEKERRGGDRSYIKLPEEEIEVKGDGYHRESFFGSHVRLITFIITMALVLTVLGPWGIDLLVNKSRAGWNQTGENADLPYITIKQVISLSNKGSSITWEMLDGYNCEDYSTEKNGKTNYNRKYSIAEDSNLCLEVIGYTDTGKPDIVRLIDYNSPEGMSSHIDIRKESAEDFLIEHGYYE